MRYIAKGMEPYGKESMSPGCIYWAPERQQLLASMPIFPNGTTTAKCDADLMWLTGYGAQSHFVYLVQTKQLFPLLIHHHLSLFLN